MTKERLQAYKAIKKEKRRLEHEIEKIEAVLYSPKTQRLTGMPRSQAKGNPAQDKIDAHTEMYAELQAFYREKVAELAAEQLAVEQAITALPLKHRTVLGYYYIDGLTWEEVCVKANYSWRQVHRIHAEALDLLKGA